MSFKVHGIKEMGYTWCGRKASEIKHAISVIDSVNCKECRTYISRSMGQWVEHRPNARHERNKKIAKEFFNGDKANAVGNRYGLTHARVISISKQIYRELQFYSHYPLPHGIKPSQMKKEMGQTLCRLIDQHL